MDETTRQNALCAFRFLQAIRPHIQIAKVVMTARGSQERIYYLTLTLTSTGDEVYVDVQSKRNGQRADRDPKLEAAIRQLYREWKQNSRSLHATIGTKLAI